MEMTPEQLERLSAHLYQSIAGNVERRLEEWWQNQSGSSWKGGGGKGGHAIIEPKFLSRVKDFLGDERSWKDCFASLTTAVIHMYAHLPDAMERVAVRAGSIQNWNSLDDWIDGNVPDEYEGPLWAVLVQHKGGEARTVVLNQIMNQEKLDGFTALGMRAQRYNSKTPSRILHALTQVLSPPTVKDVRQAPRMVEEREAAKGKLKVEFGEALSELPSDLQDKVNAGDLKYHNVRDAIVGIMNNGARVLEPTPMDIGQVGGREREREREPRAVTTGMEETNSPLSMWLQLGRACQAFVFVAGDLAISPESAQHQRAKAKGRERRVVKAAWI